MEVHLSQRTVERLKLRIGELTPRSWGQSLKTCFEGLNEYLRGWFAYFRICTQTGADPRVRRSYPTSDTGDHHSPEETKPFSSPCTACARCESACCHRDGMESSRNMASQQPSRDVIPTLGFGHDCFPVRCVAALTRCATGLGSFDHAHSKAGCEAHKSGSVRGVVGRPAIDRSRRPRCHPEVSEQAKRRRFTAEYKCG